MANFTNHKPFDGRARHRALMRRQAREQMAAFCLRSAIYVVQRMPIERVEREWRILLLTGPDDRSLTGRLLGDPRYLRSALYEKERAA